MEFAIFRKEHENNARKLLVENGIKAVEEVAYMNSREVLKEVNKHFIFMMKNGEYEVVETKELNNIVKKW